jgi:hypothetical protein
MREREVKAVSVAENMAERMSNTKMAIRCVFISTSEAF